jgi:hypothetical protein
MGVPLPVLGWSEDISTAGPGFNWLLVRPAGRSQVEPSFVPGAFTIALFIFPWQTQHLAFSTPPRHERPAVRMAQAAAQYTMEPGVSAKKA